MATIISPQTTEIVQLVIFPPRPPLQSTLYTTAKVKYLNSSSDHISLNNTLQWLPAAFRIKAKCITTAYIGQFTYLTSCAFFLSFRSCWSFISSFDLPNSSVQGLCGFRFLSFFMQLFLCLAPSHLSVWGLDISF